MVEIEIKIKIDDVPAMAKKILDQGAKLEKERFLEENMLYDFPSRLLYQRQQALRLRKMGKKTFLAFKGAPQKSRRFKIRDEYETEVKNEKQAKKILKSLGLGPVFHYKKHRSTYKKKRLKICLDETPVGNFIELEGQREEIVNLAKALGYTKKEFIKLDYVQLMEKKGKRDRR